MARVSDLEKKSYAELAEMQIQIERLKIEKQNAERGSVRQKLIDMAKQAGFEIQELFGKGRKAKGSVAVKYRDPKNPENTWTGRGRDKGRQGQERGFLI